MHSPRRATGTNAARIGVFCDGVRYHIREQLRHGHLNIDEFQKTGANLLEALKALPKLHPFDTLDRNAVTQRVTDLFTEENGERIRQYFSDRGGVGALDQAEVHIGTAYRRSRDIGAPEAERFDEAHLLPFAIEIFGSMPFPITAVCPPPAVLHGHVPLEEAANLPEIRFLYQTQGAASLPPGPDA